MTVNQKVTFLDVCFDASGVGGDDSNDEAAPTSDWLQRAHEMQGREPMTSRKMDCFTIGLDAGLEYEARFEELPRGVRYGVGPALPGYRFEILDANRKRICPAISVQAAHRGEAIDAAKRALDRHLKVTAYEAAQRKRTSPLLSNLANRADAVAHDCGDEHVPTSAILNIVTACALYPDALAAFSGLVAEAAQLAERSKKGDAE